jgi:hypothetical protein
VDCVIYYPIIHIIGFVCFLAFSEFCLQVLLYTNVEADSLLLVKRNRAEIEGVLHYLPEAVKLSWLEVARSIE